jgi:hypothetical protein
MTVIELPDDQAAALKAKAAAQGLTLKGWLGKLAEEEMPVLEEQNAADPTVAEAVRRLATFGKRHGLSLGGMTIKELLHESRP